MYPAQWGTWRHRSDRLERFDAKLAGGVARGVSARDRHTSEPPAFENSLENPSKFRPQDAGILQLYFQVAKTKIMILTKCCCDACVIRSAAGVQDEIRTFFGEFQTI